MTTLTNLDRDCFHTTLKDTDELSFSTQSLISGGSVLLNSTGSVNDVFGSARSDHTTIPAVTAGNWRAIGVLMEEPLQDRVPYRVKLYTNSASGIVHLGIGYAPSSPTGSDDTIDPVAQFSVTNNYLDEIFLIPALDSGDGDYGKALAFCGMITYNTADYCQVSLSVQKLDVGFPQYNRAIS